MSLCIDNLECEGGFSLKAELVRDDFTGFDGCSHWKVTVGRNGRTFTTNYSMGAAHRHFRNGQKINLNLRPTLHQESVNKESKPNKPELRDVLHCLVSDAQSVGYGQSFEDWCAELGYDNDSRSAEKCFNACRDEYFGLIGLGVDFAELVEVFANY